MGQMYCILILILIMSVSVLCSWLGRWAKAGLASNTIFNPVILWSSNGKRSELHLSSRFPPVTLNWIRPNGSRWVGGIEDVLDLFCIGVGEGGSEENRWQFNSGLLSHMCRQVRCRSRISPTLPISSFSASLLLHSLYSLVMSQQCHLVRRSNNNKRS